LLHDRQSWFTEAGRNCNANAGLRPFSIDRAFGLVWVNVCELASVIKCVIAPAKIIIVRSDDKTCDGAAPHMTMIEVEGNAT
jgi:hypothetical protein